MPREPLYEENRDIAFSAGVFERSTASRQKVLYNENRDIAFLIAFSGRR